MSLKASVTCFAVAPPPTSRKLAGLPPCNCSESDLRKYSFSLKYIMNKTTPITIKRFNFPCEYYYYSAFYFNYLMTYLYDIHSSHSKPCTVDQAANIAIESYIVQIVFGSFNIRFIFLGRRNTARSTVNMKSSITNQNKKFNQSCLSGLSRGKPYYDRIQLYVKSLKNIKLEDSSNIVWFEFVGAYQQRTIGTDKDRQPKQLFRLKCQIVKERKGKRKRNERRKMERF